MCERTVWLYQNAEYYANGNMLVTLEESVFVYVFLTGAIDQAGPNRSEHDAGNQDKSSDQ